MGKKKAKENDAPPKDEFDPVELITKRPQTVVLMLQSPEEGVLQTVCDVLFKFAEKAEENKAQLLSLNAMEYLLPLLSHEDSKVKRNATMCIGSMTSDPQVRAQLRRFPGCVPSLLSLLSPEEETVCHEFATQALSSLSEDYSSKLEIFEKGGLQLLISMLSSHDCDVQRSASKAVCFMLDDFQCRAALNDLNGIEPLLKLTSSDYPVIQEFALSALIKCSQESGSRNTIRDLDGLTRLVNIIGEQTMEDLHVLCLKCLENCLMDTECLQSVQNTGVFDKLLSFISESASPEVQTTAASVIAAAGKSDDNRRIFHEQETEKTLITLLTCDSSETSISAAKALATLAENLSSREKAGKLDGIPPLIKMLSNENADAREMASLALANLSTSNPGNCQVIMEKNCVPILVNLLNDERTSVQSNIAICLSNLALNETYREKILEHAVIRGLAFALQSDDSQVQVHVCQALSTFLTDQNARVQILMDGGLNSVVDLVKSNNNDVRRAASWAIVMCASDKDLAVELTKIGGLEALQEINLSSRSSTFTQTAFERILDSNLPSKYATQGILKFDNFIENGFYDAGKQSAGTKFLSIDALMKEPVNQKRATILIHVKCDEKKQEAPKTAQLEPQRNESRTQDSRGGRKSKSRQKSGIRLPSNNQSRQQTVDENQDAASQENSSECLEDKVELPDDKIFQAYCEDVKRDIFVIMSDELQVRALASFVSDAMGGTVSKTDLTTFSYELHLSELKAQLNSNVVPIGMIKQGIYYHRALLFKALADQISLSCSLVRGDYGRAWNEVKLCNTDEAGRIIMPPRLYIVDLLHSAGDLYLSGSPEGLAYQRI